MDYACKCRDRTMALPQRKEGQTIPLSAYPHGQNHFQKRIHTGWNALHPDTFAEKRISSGRHSHLRRPSASGTEKHKTEIIRSPAPFSVKKSTRIPAHVQKIRMAVHHFGGRGSFGKPPWKHEGRKGLPDNLGSHPKRRTDEHGAETATCLLSEFPHFSEMHHTFQHTERGSHRRTLPDFCRRLFSHRMELPVFTISSVRYNIISLERQYGKIPLFHSGSLGNPLPAVPAAALCLWLLHISGTAALFCRKCHIIHNCKEQIQKSMELIQIECLTKDYGKTKVLKDLSVSYSSGMIYGLAGENGAGKTTLFNCIMGLTDYKGTIRKKSDMRIGYLPAENYFYPLITGKEYLEFCIKAKGRDVTLQEIERLNEKFQLPLHRFATEYSTGMKKKLALMALLLQENDLLILDEPFNGVDLYGCIQLKKVIRSLKEDGKTILMSSHQITVLHELCDSIDYLSHHTILKRYEGESVSAMEEDILSDMSFRHDGA